jgi:hypothetical protein
MMKKVVKEPAVKNVVLPPHSLKPEKEAIALPRLKELLSAELHGKLSDLFTRSGKLHALLDQFGEEVFIDLVQLEGGAKAFNITSYFLANAENFESQQELLLYALACGKHLLDSIAAPGKSNKRARLHTAAREIAKTFHPLKFTVPESKSFIEEISPRIYPYLAGEKFDASTMLAFKLVSTEITSRGLPVFLEALRKAVKSKPVNLSAALTSLLGG